MSRSAGDASTRPLLDRHNKDISAAEAKYGEARRRARQWTLDRGSGFYQEERDRLKKPSLVETGRHAGRSRVTFRGIERRRMLAHILKRDLFTTAVHLRFYVLVAIMLVSYISCFLFWACVYFIVWKYDATCFIGFYSFASAFLFAIETQQTIGYGARAPGDCWTPAWLMAVHSILALALNSIFLGIFFAKISHPKNRGRTILISESAVVARRDGALLFMFRVADIQSRQVMGPRVSVFLYTWGHNRHSAEGEYLPLTMQELLLSDEDAVLLLPVTFTHTIDEASPLYGHTHQSLEALHAEIIVTFEGVNEFGDSFAARQSYLPAQVHWGSTFVPIIYPAAPGETQHVVDLARFHDVEPQAHLSLQMVPMSELSRRVMEADDGALPRDALGENTLIVSDTAVVLQDQGTMYLMFRVGDGHPGQMLDVRVRAFLYRYQHNMAGPHCPAAAEELDLEPSQPLLRYPATVRHALRSRSPLAAWAAGPDALRADADAELVLVATGVVYGSGRLVHRTQVYSVLDRVQWGQQFAPVVQPPSQSSDGKAKLIWDNFHRTYGAIPELSRTGSATMLLPPLDLDSSVARMARLIPGAAEGPSPPTGSSMLHLPPGSIGASASSNSIRDTNEAKAWRNNRSLAAVFQAFQQVEAEKAAEQRSQDNTGVNTPTSGPLETTPLSCSSPTRGLLAAEEGMAGTRD